MGGCQQRFVLNCILVVFFCLTPGKLHAASFESLLSEFLNLEPAKLLNVAAHGRSTETVDQGLREIYSRNNMQPFWIVNGKPGVRAQAIRAVLEDAVSHGLNPNNYFVSNIKQFWNSTDDSGLARLDIIISLGMLLYVADQQEGRMGPHLANPELFASARDVTLNRDVMIKGLSEPDMRSYMEAQAPQLLQYSKLRGKLAEYQVLEQKGGWPSVSPGQVLKPGTHDPRVKAIRMRLAVTGEWRQGLSESSIYDEELVQSVKTFQKRHGLEQDGIVGKGTLDAMNVPISFRIKQIIINMERYRWLKRIGRDEKLVAVNIASFEAAAGTAEKFEVVTPVIVGKTYHETPVFNDVIQYVDFNPFWNLPPSIARNETLPRLQQDSSYLKKHNMKIFKGWGKGAPELDATTIDWNNVSKKQMDQYHVRQEPGPKNALGTLKIVFPNEYNVYLHDTPGHELFSRDMRAFSHGCIRMGRPAEMAAYILGGEKRGWTVDRVREIVASRKRQVVKLEKPMPVYILYRTAFVTNSDDSINFYEDIYGRDKMLEKALFLPSKR